MQNRAFIFVFTLASACVMPLIAQAELRIGDLCRIKGQEENILHGMGLVVGLRGTGDGDNKTTLRALAHYMELLGHRVGTSQTGQPMLEELKNVKNVALVFVTATVPAGGAQQGDSLDCTVSAISAKSLEGGRLMLTELYGPSPGDKTVFALAQGWIAIDDPVRSQTGRIPLGCQLERKVENAFVKDGKLVLVIDKDHAGFEMAAHLEKAINQQPDFISGSSSHGVARAIDQVQLAVTVPANYADSPAQFASVLLDTRIYRPQSDTNVIINERKQVVIVGADVEIGPVAVMHKNRLIQVGDNLINEAVGFDPGADTGKTKLAALVDALNALKVPAADVIDIIKMLKHKRALFGELIIE
jgi:flagellar P-ring protein precursor FlgI